MSLVFAFGLTLLYFCLERFAPGSEAMKWLILEDGPGEYAQFVCYLLAGILLLRLRPKQWTDWCWGLLAIGLALEEVSYGGRFFGWSIDAINSHNVRHDLDLHNTLLDLTGNVHPYQLFSLGMFVAGGIEILLVRRGVLRRAFWDDKGILLFWGGMFFSYFLLRPETHAYYFEFSELLIAGAFYRQALRHSGRDLRHLGWALAGGFVLFGLHFLFGAVPPLS